MPAPSKPAPSKKSEFLARVRSAIGRAGPWRDQPLPIRLPEACAVPTEELLERFQRELEAIGGKVHRVTRAQVTATVVELATARALRTFSAWETPLLDELPIGVALEGAGLRPIVAVAASAGSPDAREQFRHLDLGITDADVGFAETGSMSLCTGPGRARLITCMPRVHIAILPVDRIVASLTELPSTVRAARTPDARLRSNVVVVTGPSRTADIENVLVVGIHGPVELHVLALTDSLT